VPRIWILDIFHIANIYSLNIRPDPHGAKPNQTLGRSSSKGELQSERLQSAEAPRTLALIATLIIVSVSDGNILKEEQT